MPADNEDEDNKDYNGFEDEYGEDEDDIDDDDDEYIRLVISQVDQYNAFMG
jgi:hypothetical protein